MTAPANREAVIAEVIRTLLPAVDDLYRAEAHGDLAGSPLELVAQKLHAGFARYGLRPVGEKGEAFDPNFHEAVVQLPTAGVTVNTVADVIEPGYALGDRLLRAAKVAVSVPTANRGPSWQARIGSTRDFYKVLGVSKDVSEAELKKTYRKLARQYHPRLERR